MGLIKNSKLLNTLKSLALLGLSLASLRGGLWCLGEAGRGLGWLGEAWGDHGVAGVPDFPTDFMCVFYDDFSF